MATVRLAPVLRAYAGGAKQVSAQGSTLAEVLSDLYERFPSLRVISAETPDESMHVGHVAYDIRAATKDVNVIFPLTRFRELAHEGIIGALAERNYSYHGLTNIPRLM